MVWPTNFDAKPEEFDPFAQEQPAAQNLQATQASTGLDHVLNLEIGAAESPIRLTGIICTMGKSCTDLEVLEQMMAAGMNIALINMCFGTKDEHVELFKMIRQAAKNYSVRVGRTYPLTLAVSLPGKKIRTGRIAEIYGDTIEIKTGDVLRITTDETYKDRCSMYTVYVDYMTLGDNLKKNTYLLIDNEKIMLKVEIISSSTITCKVERGGILGSYKDVVVPNVLINMPNFAERDIAGIEMCIHHQVDILVVNFVHSAKPIYELRNMLGDKGKKMSIVACIMSLEGYRNFDDIVEAANGIIISRLELGVDITSKKLVLAQKNMIARANKANTPIFVCADILASMRSNHLPLRAELLDISNSVMDGVDGLILTAETAIGDHPVESIRTLAATCREAENCMWSKQILYDQIDKTPIPCDQVTGTALAAVLAAQRAMAVAIVVVTTTGKSAQLISKYKPRCPVMSVTRYASIARQLHMWRGLMPLLYEASPDPDWQLDIEKRVGFCITWALDRGFLKSGDPVVIVSGWRQGTGFTNTMRIVYIPHDSSKPNLQA